MKPRRSALMLDAVFVVATIVLVVVTLFYTDRCDNL